MCSFTILRFYFVSLITLYNIFLCYSSSESFYDLLNIDKHADLLQIRRSFKKLAIKFHPDKNKDDPKAHDRFVKINRAYEILKDQDLRKKYDLYGEEGIKEGFGHQGNQYQSWTFYKDQFGIYDDDEEIVTLSGSDFDQLVVNSDQKWFINFYSAHCSHCHHVAPDWRKMAKEVEGAIMIGAVNCLDDRQICNQENIHSYPSLVLYPERIVYEGSRDRQSLIDFVLRNIDQSLIIKLDSSNFDHYFNIKMAETELSHKQRAWLIDFFNNDDENRLSDEKRKILASSLENLVNMAIIDCKIEENLCEQLGFQNKLVFFPHGQMLSKEKAESFVLNSLDNKEITKAVLSMLPDCKELTGNFITNLINPTEHKDREPWLVEFVAQNSHDNLELRKLPALLTDIKVGRFNCSKYKTVCTEDMKIFKHPTFVLFKQSGGYEMHYGRNTAHDLASFVRDCASTNVQSLQSDFLPKVLESGQMWFVDFFAPWCPPCMKLLPEFRKAAKSIGDSVKFGTIDCTVHSVLCKTYNVHSYPTTILYNMSKIPHVMVGFHSSNELIDFVEDVKNPPIVTLTDQDFDSLVLQRKSGRMWVVDFYNPHCHPCQQLAPEFRKLAKNMQENSEISFGQVDCLAYPYLCQKQYIRGYPTIRLYPLNQKGYTDYQNWFRDAASIRQWIFQWLPSLVEEIHGKFFAENLLLSESPHLVDFFAPWCGHCQAFAPEYEKVAKAFNGRVKVVKLNCDINPKACRKAGVQSYPTVRLYTGTVGVVKQHANGIDLQSQHGDTIIGIVEDYLNRKTAKSVNKDEL